MAAALLAALFAMGVFAPAGVEAIKSIPKPKADRLSKTGLSTADTNGKHGFTLTLTFELADRCGWLLDVLTSHTANRIMARPKLHLPRGAGDDANVTVVTATVYQRKQHHCPAKWP